LIDAGKIGVATTQPSMLVAQGLLLVKPQLNGRYQKRNSEMDGYERQMIFRPTEDTGAPLNTIFYIIRMKADIYIMKKSPVKLCVLSLSYSKDSCRRKKIGISSEGEQLKAIVRLQKENLPKR
jgi:hypothetical protein